MQDIKIDNKVTEQFSNSIEVVKQKDLKMLADRLKQKDILNKLLGTA